MLALIAIYKIKEGKMEEALEISRELVQYGRNIDPGLLDMFAYTVKGHKHKNEIIFVENYVDGDAFNRIISTAQNLAAYRKLKQISEAADNLRCIAIE
ncbi:MAG: putative quinol monooxygenase [Candidatus Hodarchaeota archaeon]